MDDIFIGKGPASLDVEDYQEEQWRKVEEKEDHYGARGQLSQLRGQEYQREH